MSDIVERMRAAAGEDVPITVSDLVEEAADEIERLRMERDVVCRDAAADIKSLRAEIERLRARLSQYENMPVRVRHIGGGEVPSINIRMLHVLKHGRMPDADDPR